jgi:hypothetical protein
VFVTSAPTRLLRRVDLRPAMSRRERRSLRASSRLCRCFRISAPAEASGPMPGQR